MEKLKALLSKVVTFVKEHWYRYVMSTVVTFCSGFSLAVLPHINNMTLGDLKSGGLVGLVLAGTRAGVKLVLETFLAWLKTKNQPQ